MSKKTTASLILLSLLLISLMAAENDSTISNLTDKKDEFGDILNTNRHNHLIVLWRKALIISLLIGFFVSLVIFKDFVFDFNFIIIVMLIFIAVYFTSVWFQAHWWRENNDRIEKYTLKLKNLIRRIGGKK